MIRSLGRARGACMFCGGRVGTNTVLKSSRVGAHIAFSESRCRVWLVCATCDRWNLVEPDSATAMLRECCAVFRSTAEREVSDGIGQVVSGSFRATNIDEQSPVDFLVHRHARRIQRAMRRRAVLTVPYLSAVFVPIIAANQLWGGAIGVMAGAGMALALALAINQLTQQRRVDVELPDGEPLSLTRGDINHVSLETEGASWRLRVPVMGMERVFRDNDAFAVLARAIPLFRREASPSTVSGAVQELRSVVDSNAFVRALASRSETQADGRGQRLFMNRRSIWMLRNEELVGLEILATERHERSVVNEEFVALGNQMQEALLIADIIDTELS